MKTKNARLTRLSGEWRLIRRALVILNKMFPRFWVLEIICAFWNALIPYFGLYMSSRMVNELSGRCDPRRLLNLAAVTVLGGFAISLVSRLLQSRQNVKSSFLFQRHEAFMFDAQNALPYEHLENPAFVAARFRNLENMSTFNAGVSGVKVQFRSIVENIIHIFLSVPLAVTMFTAAAQGHFDGLAGILNTPACSCILIGLIGFNVFFSIKIAVLKTKVNDTASAELAHDNVRDRYYSARWGSDMITFGLNRIVLEEYRKHMLRPGWLDRLEKADLRYDTALAVLNTAQTLGVFLFTAGKAFMGAFGIGNFILYQGAVERFVKAVSGLATDIGKLINNNQYLQQLYDFIGQPDSMYRGTLAVEHRDDLDYEIEFRDVSFKYPRTDTWALRHINLKFRIGEKIAIVGENGSGKTTFIKLLCRLYDPTEGQILLNGIDITRYRSEEYTALFSVVFQDYTIFGFPLGENVAANHVYDAEKVRSCLIRAGMGEKLAGLEMEYGRENALLCPVGRSYDSEGIDFSGGELQKIALARALYKDAPFMILDEPTAALDPIAEAEVYARFNEIASSKTSVFISHRLSSCKFCDEIAVFQDGALVQLGSHADLAAEESGKYFELWHAQAKYYTEKTE